MATSLDKLRYDLLQFSSISTGLRGRNWLFFQSRRCRKLRDSAENKLMSTANFLASALGTAARHSDDGQGIVQRCALVRSRAPVRLTRRQSRAVRRIRTFGLSRQRLDISRHGECRRGAKSFTGLLRY